MLSLAVSTADLFTGGSYLTKRNEVVPKHHLMRNNKSHLVLKRSDLSSHQSNYKISHVKVGWKGGHLVQRPAGSRTKANAQSGQLNLWRFFSYIYKLKSEHFFEKSEATFLAAPINIVIKTPTDAHRPLPSQSSAAKNSYLFSS